MIVQGNVDDNVSYLVDNLFKIQYLADLFFILMLNLFLNKLDHNEIFCEELFRFDYDVSNMTVLIFKTCPRQGLEYQSLNKIS